MNERARGPLARWSGPYPLPYTLWVLFLALLVSGFSTLDRTIVSILIDEIGAEFELSDAQLGLLLGPSFAIVYAFLTLPMARLADVWVRRWIVAGSLFLWSIFTAAGYWVTTFGQLFLTRMGVGVGEAGGTAPNISLLSDYLPPAFRARGIAVISVGATLGMGAGMLIGGQVAEASGWRAALLAAGLPGMALALLYSLTVREPTRGASEPGRTAGSAPVGEVVRHLLANRTYVTILIANGFSLFAAMGRNMWEPAFIIRLYDMGPADAGLWYFLTSPLPSAFGIWLGGRLADGMGRDDPRWYLWIPAAGQAISVPILVAFLLWPQGDTLLGVPFAFYLSFVGSIVGSFFTAPFMATIQGVARLRMRAVAAGMSTLVSTLVGLCIGPLLVGVVSDSMSTRFGDEAIRYSLLIPTAAPLFSALVCLIGARRVAADLARVDDEDSTR
jgi:MFS family permease